MSTRALKLKVRTPWLTAAGSVSVSRLIATEQSPCTATDDLAFNPVQSGPRTGVHLRRVLPIGHRSVELGRSANWRRG